MVFKRNFMLYKIFLILLICIVFSCTNEHLENNSESNCDTFFVIDTLGIEQQIIPNYNSLSNSTYKLFEKSKEVFYNVVVENYIDSSFSVNFNKTFSTELLVYCLLFEDEKVNKSVILFFLKYHYSILQKNNGCSHFINNEVNYGKNKSYMSLLFYQYSRITGTTGIMYSNDVVFWIMEHNEFLLNSETNKIFNLIENHSTHKKSIKEIRRGALKGDTRCIKYVEVIGEYYNK